MVCVSIAIRSNFEQVMQPKNATGYLHPARSADYVSDPPKSWTLLGAAKTKIGECGVPLEVPPAREYGWELKNTNTSLFKIINKENGQFAVILEHSLVRGITPEMFVWWFERFGTLKVQLKNVPGYENKIVSAYMLWHPYDHICIAMKNSDKAGHMQIGTKMSLAECMNFRFYGYKYLVDSTVTIANLTKHGLVMSRHVPLFGQMMAGRIYLKPVEGGVHYHYEIAVGLDESKGFFGGHVQKKINNGAKQMLNPELFAAWQTHNVHEVGTFENFLPALYAQREEEAAGKTIVYDAKTMNAAAKFPAEQVPFDPKLFARRVEDLTKTKDAVRLIMTTPEI